MLYMEILKYQRLVVNSSRNLETSCAKSKQKPAFNYLELFIYKTETYWNAASDRAEAQT